MRCKEGHPTKSQNQAAEASSREKVGAGRPKGLALWNGICAVKDQRLHQSSKAQLGQSWDFRLGMYQTQTMSMFPAWDVRDNSVG